MTNTTERTYKINFITVCENGQYRNLHYKSDELLVRKLLKVVTDEGKLAQISIEGITYCDEYNSENSIEIGLSEFVNNKQRSLRFKRKITDSPLETL